MKKHIILLEIIFYAAIPYVIWNYGRGILGDYYALLISTVPGIVYTLYRFIKDRQLNITGMFIIASLLVGTTVNLLSSSAENMLWNQVYVGSAFAGIFILSIAIKKPLALYFAVDFAFLQGHLRGDSKSLYKNKGLFMWFQLLTLIFVIRGLFQNGLKSWLIYSYGVEAYNQLLIYMNVSGWIFSGLIMLGYVLVNIKISKFLDEQNTVESSESQL